MAGPAPSSEKTHRRVVRMALGASLAFAVAQFFAWPLAHPMPVFVALLLQEPGPISIRTGLGIIATAVGSMLASYALALSLSAYPAVMVVVYCLLLFRFYLFLLTSGAHLLSIVGALFGAAIVPVLVVVSPQIASLVIQGFLLDFVVALLLAWVMFVLLPAPADPATRAATGLPLEQALPVARGLVTVTAPLVAAFLLFGWTDILVLTFALLIAASMSAERGAQAGGALTLANLMFGGAIMAVTYEILVMVPSLPFMLLLIIAVSLGFGRQIFSGRPSAALWASGFNGFLILLGGALLKEDVVSSATILGRVSQIFLATTYVVFAYSVLDLLGAICDRLPRCRQR